MLGALWLAFGAWITIALAVQFSQALIEQGSALFGGVAEIFVIGIVVGLLSFFSGWALFRQKRFGWAVVLIVSLIHLAYF
jgi:hypothetical protein